MRFLAALTFAVMLLAWPAASSAHEARASGAGADMAEVAATPAYQTSDQDDCNRSRSAKPGDRSCCATACHAAIPACGAVLSVQTMVTTPAPFAPQPRIVSGRLKHPTPPPKLIGRHAA